MFTGSEMTTIRKSITLVICSICAYLMNCKGQYRQHELGIVDEIGEIEVNAVVSAIGSIMLTDGRIVPYHDDLLLSQHNTQIKTLSLKDKLERRLSALRSVPIRYWVCPYCTWISMKEFQKLSMSCFLEVIYILYECKDIPKNHPGTLL